MVIHDMRNPTVAIKAGLQDTLAVMDTIKILVDKDQKIFHARCKRLLELVNEKLHNDEIETIAARIKDIGTKMQDLVFRLKMGAPRILV